MRLVPLFGPVLRALPVERRLADRARGRAASGECLSLDVETLRGSSSVAMVKATNLRQGNDAAELGRLYRARFGRILCQ